MGRGIAPLAVGIQVEAEAERREGEKVLSIAGVVKARYGDFIVQEIDQSNEKVPLPVEVVRTTFEFDNEEVGRHLQSVGQLSRKELEAAYSGDSEYLHLHLYKENRSQEDALQWCAKALGVPANEIGIAGTKDKRAVTSQVVSVKKSSVPSAVLARSGSSLPRTRNPILLYHPHAGEGGLQLGKLGGNYFSLIIRDGVVHECDKNGGEKKVDNGGVDDSELERVLKRRVDNMKESGMINYFGTQRFGLEVDEKDAEKIVDFSTFARAEQLLSGGASWRRSSSLLVGVHILRGDFKRALQLSCIHSQARVLPKLWRDDKSDPAELYATISKLGKRKKRSVMAAWEEYALLAFCDAKKKGDGEWDVEEAWRAALKCIPWRVRSKCISAVQSLVFNEMALMQSKLPAVRHGNVTKGDLILDETEEKVNVGESCDIAESEDKGNKRNRKRVRVAAEGEGEAKKEKKCDLYLPVPGYDTIYPDNDVGRFGQNLVSSLAIRFDAFDEYMMDGDYRPFRVYPSHQGVDVIRVRKGASDLPHIGGRFIGMPTESNVKWQKECIKRREADALSAVSEEGETQSERPAKKPKIASDYGDHGSAADADKLAVRLSFCLPPASYATVYVQHVLGKEPGEPGSQPHVDA